MKVREIIKQSAPLPPKVLDLTGLPLNRVGAAEVLGDLLSVDFGLKSLVLSGCSLEDHCLKPILHGLLVSGTLPSISLANNPKLRAKGWKLVAIFVKKVGRFHFLFSPIIWFSGIFFFLPLFLVEISAHQILRTLNF
jgi:hypothetical protein